MPTKISSYLTELGFRQIDWISEASSYNKENAGEFLIIKETNRMFRYEENSDLPITNTDTLATLDGGTSRWIAVGGAATTQIRIQHTFLEESDTIPLGIVIASKNNVLFVNVSNTQILSNEFTLNAEKNAVILSEKFPAGTETEVVVFVADFTQTHDYSLLADKPWINDVELEGKLSLHDLGIQEEGNYARLDRDNIYVCNNDFTGDIKLNGNLEVIGNVDLTEAETLVASLSEDDRSQHPAPTEWVKDLTEKSIEAALETTYSKEEIDQKIDEKDSLPVQENNEGKFLSTNGTEASWEDLPVATDEIFGITKLASEEEITEGTSETSVVVVKQLKDATTDLDTKLLAEIAKKADKNSDFESPITADNKGATMKELRDMETSSLTFKGFIGTEEPDENILDLFEGNLWINSDTMPENFPISKDLIKVYDGDNWIEYDQDYTPKAFDSFRNMNDNEGYYWFGGEWVVLSTDLSTEDFVLGDDGKWLIVDSVELRGLPTLENTPISDMGIANKKYVDDEVRTNTETKAEQAWTQEELDKKLNITDAADTYETKEDAQSAYEELENKIQSTGGDVSGLAERVTANEENISDLQDTKADKTAIEDMLTKTEASSLYEEKTTIATTYETKEDAKNSHQGLQNNIDTKQNILTAGDGIQIQDDVISVTNVMPDGGTEGQLLVKTATGYGWQDAPCLIIRDWSK